MKWIAKNSYVFFFFKLFVLYDLSFKVLYCALMEFQYVYRNIAIPYCIVNKMYMLLIFLQSILWAGL